MIFFRARPVGGELEAGDDAADAKVFPTDEIPLLPFRTHREMIAQWLAQRGEYKDAHLPLSERPDFTIRPAEAADANEIMALLHLIPANRSLTRDAWREVYQRFREAAGIEVFVAVDRADAADHHWFCSALGDARADGRARLDQRHCRAANVSAAGNWHGAAGSGDEAGRTK